MELLRDILATLPPSTPAMAWALAAGPALAERARCLGLRDGVLRLQAEDADAGRQIESVAPELLRGLNRMLGAGQVQRLHIRL